MTRNVSWLVTLALGAAFLMLGTGCGQDGPGAPPSVRPVRTVQVPAPSAVRQHTFSGTAKNVLETALSFRVEGEIIELPARIGSSMQRGDTVARLDPTDYRLKHQQAVADRERARAAYVQARADIARIRKLFEKKVISKSELDQAQANYDSAAAQLSAARQQVDIANQHLKYTVLRAPVDGRIAAVPVDRHQTVAAGQTVATLNSGGSMEVKVGVPDSIIAKVDVGQEVSVTFDVLHGKSCVGSVSEVGVKPGPSATYPLRAALTDCDEHIRSGMTASVTFTLARNGDKDTVLVPAVAVIGDADGSNHVWVVEDGKARKHPVVPAGLTSDGLEIVDGLQPGDTLVVRGMHSLKDGMDVRPTPLDAHF